MVELQSTLRFALDLDPDLGRPGIPDGEWALARSACPVETFALPTGSWDVAGASAALESFAFVLVDGAVAREIVLRDRHLLELLGPGDVVLPPARDMSLDTGLPLTVTTTFVSGRAFALGEAFATACSRWPSLLADVMRRTGQQHERLAVQALIVHLPVAEHRLLLQLWHLTSRWGRVTKDGILFPFSLTHEMLGHLIAARRPTVTLAATNLQATDCLHRLDDGTWLLTEAGERRARRMVERSDLPGSLGEALQLRQETAELCGEARALRSEARQAKAQRARIMRAGDHP